jgi:hypothetical protein
MASNDEDIALFPSSNLGAASFLVNNDHSIGGALDDQRPVRTPHMAPLRDSRLDFDPGQSEGERKVKMGLSGMPRTAPRIRLPSICARSLPRHLTFPLRPGRHRDATAPSPAKVQADPLERIWAEGADYRGTPSAEHLLYQGNQRK